MSDDAPPKAKPPFHVLHMMATVGVGFALWAAAMILSCAIRESLRWTDAQWGWDSGVFMGVLAVSILGIPLLAVALGTWAICVYRRWTLWRTWIMLAPFAAAALWAGGDMAFPAFYQPIPASERFQEITGEPLPASAKDVKTYFFGGGFTDRADRICFTCSPEDAQRLIAAWDLEEKSELTQSLPPHFHPFYGRPGPGWPDPFQWVGRHEYGARHNGSTLPKNIFLTVITNADKTQLFIFHHTF